MDDLDDKLEQERARLVALLTAMAKVLTELPADRLDEVLPMAAGIHEVLDRLRLVGVKVGPDPYATSDPLDGARASGPVDQGGIVR